VPQPPPRELALAQPGTPAGFHTRAMPEIANPVYPYNLNADFKRTGQPTHALERPAFPAGVDPRLTVQGDTSRAADLTPIVGMAYQTPQNVWGLYPA
jgi:hypothetical protein